MRYRTTLVGTARRARLTSILVVNGALALSLVALYILTLTVLSWCMGGSPTPLTHASATIIVALSVVPLRSRLWVRLNALLHRRWQHSNELLHEISASLSRAIEPQALAAILIDDLPARLDLDGAALWMLDPADDRVFTVVGASVPVADAPLLANGATVLQLSQTLHTGGYLLVPSEEWTRPFTERRLRLVFPLPAGDRVVGIYGCGAPLDGHSLPAPVFNLLRTLTPVIAGAVENTRAYEKIAHLNEQLRAFDQLKGEFIESVGHELRTPLTSLNLALELLKLQPSVPESLTVIMRGSLDRLQGLVNQALAFEERTRHEENRRTTASALINLADVSQELLERFAPIAKAKQLDLRATVEPGLAVWGSHAAVERALREVLDNALRYTWRGAVTLRATLDDGLAIIAISDSGTGIPEDERDQLFSAFYRGRGARALAETPGAGLGLSIAQHEVESMGGQIWIESTGPEGTVVSLSLPGMILYEHDEHERVVGA